MTHSLESLTNMPTTLFSDLSEIKYDTHYIFHLFKPLFSPPLKHFLPPSCPSYALAKNELYFHPVLYYKT